MARHLELEMQSELSVDYVKAVAGIFQASGYFGDRTVDQLATLIFVGDALGLKPANAVFDLEVKDGAIQYKAAEAFRKAADQVDELKASIEGITLRAPSGEVVQLGNNSANKGPLPFQKTERPLDGPQAGKREPGQQEPAKRADLSDSDTAEPASRPEKADIATPKPASAAAVDRVEPKPELDEDVIDRYRTDIQRTLSREGMPSFDTQKGFFIYAGVNLNPFEWTLQEARKAHADLKPFLERTRNVKKTLKKPKN